MDHVCFALSNRFLKGGNVIITHVLTSTIVALTSTAGDASAHHKDV